MGKGGSHSLSLSLSAVAEVLCSVVFFGLDLGLGDGFSLLSNIDFLYYYHTTLSLFCFFLLVSFLFFSFRFLYECVYCEFEFW